MQKLHSYEVKWTAEEGKLWNLIGKIDEIGNFLIVRLSSINRVEIDGEILSIHVEQS